MHVRRLSLTDFRNYRSADLELAPGPQVFAGPNGQGKTNLVEAIGFLGTLGSHRVSGDQALIRAGAASAIIRAVVVHADREVLLEAQINQGSPNRAQINRSATRPRELPRHFASVLFAPEDLTLVRGDPSARRRFLDDLLVARTPRLAGVQADYDRTVRQRSSLLKTARAQGLRGGALPTLDIWDDRLVELGTELIGARGELVAALAPHVQAAYTAIAGADHGAALGAQLSIDGDEPTDGPVEHRFRAALERVRRAEFERGLTLVGPHRDDLVLTLNALPVKGYASHGESWSFALGLKLASAALLRIDAPAGDPVVVLDDVFAELDEARRERLASAVGDYEQVLVTAAVEADVPDAFRGAVTRIAAGTIVPSADADEDGPVAP